MFVYFIFDGSFICRCLYIFRPSSVPRHSICSLQLEAYTLFISHLYLQILHSASENSFFIVRWLRGMCDFTKIKGLLKETLEVGSKGTNP